MVSDLNPCARACLSAQLWQYWRPSHDVAIPLRSSLQRAVPAQQRHVLNLRARSGFEQRRAVRLQPGLAAAADGGGSGGAAEQDSLADVLMLYSREQS
jgi:hypothetical protein